MASGVMTVGLKINRTVRVSNVSESVDPDQLRIFLSALGTVEDLQRDDGVGRRAVWTVVFDTERDAKAAAVVHGTPLMGVPVEIRAAAAVEAAALTAAGGVAGEGGAPDIDPITMAAVRAAQEEEGRKAAEQRVAAAAAALRPPPAAAAAAAPEPVEGGGLTPELLRMVREQPALASQLIPTLMAQSDGTANAQQLQVLQIAATFHKQRAEREQLLRNQQQQMELVKRLREAEGEGARRRRRRSDSSTSSDSSSSDSSSSASSEPSKRRRRRRRRHSAGGSRNKRGRERGEKAEKGRRGAGEPAAGVSTGADGSGTADRDYISRRETKYLYVVFPRGGRELPATAAASAELDRHGTLTAIKVSKSTGCLYVSYNSASAAAKVKERMEKARRPEYAGAAWHFARSSYQTYLAEAAGRGGGGRGRSRSRSRRRRRRR